MAEIWVAGATVASAAAGYASSQNAAKKGQAAANASLDEQRRQFDINQQNQQPWLDAGRDALGHLTTLSGQFGRAPTAEEVMADPGYQFGLSQGRNALEGSAAAAGGLYSGAAGKALTQFGNDYATTKYDDAFNRKQSAENAIWNRYAGLAGVGQSAANQVGAYGQNYANNVGSILQGNANFQGAAGIAGSNALMNGLNQGVSWWQQNRGNGGWGGWGGWGGTSAPAGNGMGGALDGFGTGAGLYATPMADGGPVRKEPVVGTRSPVRTGGGGGLTPNALLQLVTAPQPQPQLVPGMGQLVANPLVDPQAILAERLRQVGAYAVGGPVHGPGGPRDDEVPAMLSDGEQVLTAKAVRGAGNGSRERGHANLNKLQVLLERRG